MTKSICIHALSTLYPPTILWGETIVFSTPVAARTRWNSSNGPAARLLRWSVIGLNILLPHCEAISLAKQEPVYEACLTTASLLFLLSNNQLVSLNKYVLVSEFCWAAPRQWFMLINSHLSTLAKQQPVSTSSSAAAIFQVLLSSRFS